MTDLLITSTSSSVDMDERIAAKAGLEAAEEQLRSLCASHAGTFVAVERRGRALEAALQELLEKVQALDAQVSLTKQALEQEEGGGDEQHMSLAALSEKHRVRRRTLLQHSSLLELLELPSLMDACVRSSLYDEALSIAAFANTLERRHHNEKNPVVLKVIDQVRSRQSDLRRYLLHSLKNSVTMPECLEIVTALRRLNSIDLERLPSEKSNLERFHSAMEYSLQVDFLEARDTWLDLPSVTATAVTAFLGSGTHSNPSSRGGKGSVQSSEHLLDVIERYRTRMFEIATQFNAIFRAQQMVTTNSTDNSVNSHQQSLMLLSMWTSRRIHSFLHLLSVELNTMEESASLRDALDASVFFAQSMGRLGADFTSLMSPMFEEKMVEIVRRHWTDGTTQLEETLKVCRDAGVASPLVSSAAAAEAAFTDSTDGGVSSISVMMPPPRQLIALPPLGRVVNSFLTGLNELRRCLLPGIFSPLRVAMEQDFLVNVKNTLHAHERAVMTPGLRGEAVKLRDVAKQMKEVAKTIIFPYVRGALELSFGNVDAARELFDKVSSIVKPAAPVALETESLPASTTMPSDAAPEKEQVETQQTTSFVSGRSGTLGASESNDPVHPQREDWANEGFDDL